MGKLHKSATILLRGRIPPYYFKISKQLTISMITMLYGNIQEIRDEDINLYVQLLPEKMQRDVLRYKYPTDQKARVLARLMLLKSMKDTGRANLFDRWERDSNNKPFIEGWDAFSISHSGELVVLCHAPTPIGVDIEKKLPINYIEMLEHFHPEEQEFIIRSTNGQQSFYTVWTRKEAFLKAVGLGITNGLRAFNCVHESITYQGKEWYFYELPFHPAYSCYLCCPYKELHSRLKCSTWRCIKSVD
jgi:4'-phosphopantetheinyl transferase